MAQDTCQHCKGTGKETITDRYAISDTETLDRTRVITCDFCSGTGTLGCRNQFADYTLRNCKAETWSDCNLTETKFDDSEFAKLICTCGHDEFKVVSTGYYQTSARCTKCLKWYIVHSG